MDSNMEKASSISSIKIHIKADMSTDSLKVTDNISGMIKVIIKVISSKVLEMGMESGV